MSNVIAFGRPGRTSVADPRLALFSNFATERRAMNDVFWLKENAELLGIFASLKVDVPHAALACYEGYYAELKEKLELYPQYYRFLLSICLDLEDLGLPGRLGEGLCAWVARQGFAKAELSDLQRAEARRLLARRGLSKPVDDGALGDRLRRFIGRSETFALPNKKAAYELTHIIFYLSEYGARKIAVAPDAVRSLEYAGVLAFLDQNLDLLSEICTAMQFVGKEPSPIWTQAVLRFHDCIRPFSDSDRARADAYHEYLVSGWAAHLLGGVAFGRAVPMGGARFEIAQTQQGALGKLSQCLSDLGASRSGDWGVMRGHVLSYLGQSAHDVLLEAEQSTEKFGEFFEGFARAGWA